MSFESYDKLLRANLNEYLAISHCCSSQLLTFVEQQANLSQLDLQNFHEIMVLIYNKNYEFRDYCTFPYFNFILKRYSEVSKRELQVIYIPKQYKLIGKNAVKSLSSQRQTNIFINEFCLMLSNNEVHYPNMQHLCCTKCLYLNSQVQLGSILQGKLYSQESLKELIQALIINGGGSIYFGIQNMRVKGQKISEQNKIKIQKMIARTLMNIPGSENYNIRVEFVPIITDQLRNEYGESLYCTRIYAQLKNQLVNSFKQIKTILFQKHDHHSCEQPYKGKPKQTYEEQVYHIFGKHEEFPILIHQYASVVLQRNIEYLQYVNVEHSIYRCHELFFIFHREQFPSNVSKTFKKVTKYIKLSYKSQKQIKVFKITQVFQVLFIQIEKKSQKMFYTSFQQTSHALYAYAYFNDIKNQFVNEIPVDCQLIRQYYDQWNLIYKF